MIEIRDKSMCCGCEACKNICPKKCIIMKKDEEGFEYPEVDETKCINCGACNRVCQYEHEVNELQKDKEPEVYSCTINDKKELKNSTTAAVFFNLASYVIENEGVVYGVKYDSKMKVVHTRTENLEELNELRGSKYIQSKIGQVYTLIKKDLNNNKIVLFSGTPCQVGGLYKFLGKNYKNLITVDIICFGVPSPGIYMDYLDEQEKKYKSKIKNIDFRDKANGWNNSYTRIKFENENINYYKPSNENEWYATFTSHICTRKACNNCLYTSLYRKSDITIGDFWGIEKIDSKIDSRYGVEKVILNTNKGTELFNKISYKYNIQKRKLKEAIRPNLQHPPKENKNREDFFVTYNKKGFNKAYTKFVKNTFSKKIKRKIGELKRKILKEE